MLRKYLLVLVLLGWLPALCFATEPQASSQSVVAKTKVVKPKAKLAQAKSSKPKAKVSKTKTSKTKTSKTKTSKTKNTKHASAKQRSVKQTKSKQVQAKHSKSKLAKSTHSKKSLAKTKAPTPIQQVDADTDDDISQTSDSVTIPRIESPRIESRYNATTKIGTSAKTQQLIDYAYRFLGTNYRFGGHSPDTGFDCSGYVSYVYGHAAGIALPHNASAISRVGARIPRANLRPGDLVFFGHFRRAISHVGIYMGNNRFIHASSSRTGYVQISDLRESYWTRNFEGARRLMASS